MQPSWEHSIACGVFTNDDGRCTCKEDPASSAATVSLEDALGFLREKAWADYGSNVVVDDCPLEVWIDRVLRGETPERAGREYHPRSKVDNG